MPKLKIRNKATGEIKEIEASEAQNFGLDPKVALERFKAQSELEKAAGGKDITLSDKEVEKQSKYKDVAQTVDILEKNLQQVKQRGPTEGRLAEFLAGITRGAVNPEVADYEALRKSLIGPLARTISGEVGVLTDKDIARAEGLLPKVADDPKLIENKLKNLREMIGTRTGERAQQSPQGSLVAQAPQTQDTQPQQQNTGNFLIDALLRGSNAQEKLSNRGLGGANYLGELLFPRAAAISQRQAQGGPNASLDEATGVLGETAANLLPFFGPGGLTARLALSGASRGLTEPRADVGERVKSGAVQGGTQAALGGISRILGLGAGKLGFGANKARTVAAEAFEATGGKIGGNKATIDIAKQMVKEDLAGPEYKPLIKELAKGKGVKPTDALNLLIRAGKKTFTQGGDKRLADQAEFYSLLRKGLREDFQQKVPEIIKRTSDLARGYKAGGVAKKTAIYGGLASAGIGGLSALYGLLTGKFRGGQ